MARTKLLHIPFAAGQREDVDPKLLPAGYLTRAKNVRLRKDGRWGVRYGDTALATTTNQASALIARDLVAFDDRLFVIGDGTFGLTTYPTMDLYEYVNVDSFAWRATHIAGAGPAAGFVSRLSLVTGVRDMGRSPTHTANVEIMDVAAHDGLVCLAYEPSGTNETQVHIFTAENDATLLFETLSIVRPRVIRIGTVFYVAGIDSNGTAIELYSFDPANDETMQAETDIFAAGNTINFFDLTQKTAGTGAWAVITRSGPTTEIAELESDGTVGTTFSGPSVAFTHVSICETTNRVALVVVLSADSTVELYTYTHAGTQNPVSNTQLFSGVTTLKQPGVVKTINTDVIAVFIEGDGTPNKDVHMDARIATDHTLNGSRSWNETTLGTKPVTLPSIAQDSVTIFGGVQSEGTFRGNFLGNLPGEFMQVYKDRFTAGVISVNHLPRIAYDAAEAKFYWPNLISQDQESRQVPQVTEFLLDSRERRQTVDMGGLLYIFGGLPQVFDTRFLCEAGFCEVPVINNIAASNGAGSLPTSTTLQVAILWEWYDSRGFLHRSPLSEVETVTMGASDDTIAFTASVPHSLRNNSTAGDVNRTIKIVAYRSLAGKKQLRRADTENVSTTFGDDISFTLTASDSSIAENEVIYTQGGRGALGDILEHESPQPADLACRFGKRILTGKLPDPFAVQVSKPLFPGEPVNWSGDEAFIIRIPDRVQGIAAQDLNGYIFSRRGVWVFTGEGPDDTGAGTFTDPAELPSSIGIHRASSIVVAPVGILYQADEEKIFRIPRGGGEPEWFGQAVRDTLADFPVVTAAAVLPTEQLVTFACNNTSSTDGRLIHYDLRGQTWIVDEFDGSTPVTSVVEYQGRLARLSGGVVTVANETHPAASFIEHSLITGTLRPFGENAWGQLIGITFLGEFRGNCVLTCLISYDDGENWTTLNAFDLDTADGLAAGDTIRRQWYPRRRKGDRFMLEFRVTALSGAASEGLVFNAYTLEVMGATGAARLGSGKRG